MKKARAGSGKETPKTKLPKKPVSKETQKTLKKAGIGVFKLSTKIRAWDCICWSCYYCNITFNDYQSLQSHQQKLHQIESARSVDYYRCIECKENLLGYASFLNHMRNVHYEALKLCCDVCNEILGDYKKLSIHRDKHVDLFSQNTPIIYHCSLCSEVYSSENLLKHHLQGAHNLIVNLKTAQDSLLECGAEEIKSLEPLTKVKEEIPDELINCEDEHKETKTIYQCGKCSKTLKSAMDLKNHVCIYFNDGGFKCNECVFCFKTEEDRKNHMRAHSTQYAFTCRLCKKSFNRSFALRVHMRTHANNVACECYVCDMKFTNLQMMMDHLKTREHGERPLKCKRCKKDFKYKGSYTKHLCVVPGEVNFKCEICQKEYANIKGFKNHKRKHAAGEGLECEICRKLFKKSLALKVHMRLHIGKPRNECDICGKTYKKPSALKSHKKSCTSIGKKASKKGNSKST